MAERRFNPLDPLGLFDWEEKAPIVVTTTILSVGPKLTGLRTDLERIDRLLREIRGEVAAVPGWQGRAGDLTEAMIGATAARMIVGRVEADLQRLARSS
ncbi:hypothetical protein LCGC14_0833120 [marine sediment metagenome]|uniref:Uncharacterized protein n=1 Tax=marine sediment metagenome TaxID=412755 RepID=A0A0F9Q0J7_9ZZZZ